MKKAKKKNVIHLSFLHITTKLSIQLKVPIRESLHGVEHSITHDLSGFDTF